MKKKGKLLGSLAVLLLVMVCAAWNPKTVKAAAENITMKNAKTIKIGDEINETYNDKDKKHESRYYKFTVPVDIGNKWIDFQLRNSSDISCDMKLYNDLEEELDKVWGIGTDSTDKLHLSVAESEHNNDVQKLIPGKSYYLAVVANQWGGDYSKDFSLSSNTVEDDNWGSNEKATEVKKYDTWEKGVLEYTDDVDRYCVKLPADKKKYIIKLWADEYMDVTLEDEFGLEISSDTLSKNNTVNGFEVTGNGEKVYIKFEADDFPDWIRDAQYKYMISSPRCSHKVSNWKITKSPTVFAKGKKVGKCSRCGAPIEQTIKKISPTISVKKSITLKAKKSTTITVKYKKGDGIASWKSSNKKIATVRKSGKVTGKKKGKAVLTVKLKSGKTAKVRVTVK